MNTALDEIDQENVPQNLSEAFPDAFPEKELQFHTGTSSGSGNRPAMFHGHDISNDIKNRIRQWFRTIDKEVGGLLSDAQSPLVLAGVDTLFPLYKEVNTYPHLMEEGVPGNPEGMKPEDLHPQAWAIVEPVFRKEREAGSARYRQLAGTGRPQPMSPRRPWRRITGGSRCFLSRSVCRCGAGLIRRKTMFPLTNPLNPVTRTFWIYRRSRPCSKAAQYTRFHRKKSPIRPLSQQCCVIEQGDFFRMMRLWGLSFVILAFL